MPSESECWEFYRTVGEFTDVELTEIASKPPSDGIRSAARHELRARGHLKGDRLAIAAFIVSLLALGFTIYAYFFPRQ